MKIGIITGEYPPMQGGVGDYTRAFAGALTDQGHAVDVLAPTGSIGDPGFPYTIHPLMARWGPGSLRTVRNWARRGQFEVLSLQFETAAYQMSPWVHLLPWVLRPCPVVTTFHDLKVPYLFPKAGPLRPFAVNTLARNSRAAIVTNSADEQALRRAGARAVRALPIGSNIPTAPPTGFDRTQWRAQVTTTPGAMLIGYFGFMNASKGVDTLVRAARLLRDSGVEAHLILIGGRTGASDPANAAYAQRVEALIGNLDLSDYVHWTGFVEPSAVSAWLMACDVIALPFTDGASLRRGSLMAALAHGCAIVTTPPQQPEPDLEGTAEFVPSTAPQPLADAIARVCSDTDRRNILSTRALEASSQFAWPSIAARYTAFVRAEIGVRI